MDRIVIIGNGAAGNSAADTVHRLNPEASIIMVAREPFPEYSACALPDYLSGWVKREQLFIKRWDDYERKRINVLSGREVTRIDAQRCLLDTDLEEIEYDYLLITTGSRAFIPPVPGHDLAGNFVVKTINDIDGISLYPAQRAVVVGSGNIGIEMAEALHSRGCKVMVVELMDHILPRIFDQKPAERLGSILIDHGIEIFTGEKVTAVVGKTKAEAVTTSQRTIPCDMVIWAAGVKQNAEIAREAGITIGDLGGIRVNSYMQTNFPNIYAAGDCIESLDFLTGLPTLSLLWPNAKRQGEVAAYNCTGHKVEYEGSVNLVMEDFCGITATSMGLTWQGLKNSSALLLEGENPNQYWRVVVQNDRIMGMQAIGVTSGLGAVMAMLRNRITLNEFNQIISDPDLVTKAAWYLPARPFLSFSNHEMR